MRNSRGSNIRNQMDDQPGEDFWRGGRVLCDRGAVVARHAFE